MDKEIVYIRISVNVVICHKLLYTLWRTTDGKGKNLHAVNHCVIGRTDNAIAEVLILERLWCGRLAESSVRRHQRFIAFAHRMEVDNNVISCFVIFQSQGRTAITKEGHTTLILHRTHPQCCISHQHQGSFNLTRSDQVASYSDGIHTTATAHWNIHTETVFR